MDCVVQTYNMKTLYSILHDFKNTCQTIISKSIFTLVGTMPFETIAFTIGLVNYHKLLSVLACPCGLLNASHLH